MVEKFVFILPLALVVFGGVLDHKPREGGAKGDTREMARPVSPQDSDIYRGLPPSFRDSLMAKMRRYNITKNEYWEGRGGLLASEEMQVWYPAKPRMIIQGMYLFEQANLAREHFIAVFGETPKQKPYLVCTRDLREYKEMTGREWWYYSDMRGDTIIFQPVYVLVNRRLATIAIPHEYYQWAIRRISGLGAPRWLEEGLASYLSKEKDVLTIQMREFKEQKLEMSPEEVEAVLTLEMDRVPARIAYYHAYRMVERLIAVYGLPKFKTALLLLGKGKELDDAFTSVFKKPYEDVLKIASDYTIDL